jgi:hypothetical protein
MMFVQSCAGVTLTLGPPGSSLYFIFNFNDHAAALPLPLTNHAEVCPILDSLELEPSDWSI